MKPMFRFLLPALLLSITAARAQETIGPRVMLPDEGASATPLATTRAVILAKAPAAPAAFAAAHPAWQFRFNERCGTFHRAWGDGLRIPGYSSITAANVADAAAGFIGAYASALGVRPEELRLLSALPAGGTWYVKYIQQYRGLDVLNAYVDLRMTSDGRVFLFGSDFNADPRVSVVPELSEAAAAEFAKAGLTYIPGSAHISAEGLAVLPLHFADRTEYRLVYRFILAQRADESWNTFVDAHSGNVLWRWNLSRSADAGAATLDAMAPDAAAATIAEASLPSAASAERDGTTCRTTAGTVDVLVTGSIYPDSYAFGADTVAVPHAYVWIGGTMYTTDADGRFTADLGGEATAPVIARLSGPHAIARRADSLSGGKNAVLQTTAIAGQPLVIHWDNDNSTAAERNAFYNATRVRDFIRGLDTSSAMKRIDAQMTTVVNIADSCNAFWDGNRVNFFRRSVTCANTAEIPDVIYHELGHGINKFLYTAVRGSEMSSDAINEGTADINANMMRDDPRIGLSFYTASAGGTLRNSDNTLRYPEDYIGEGHYDGRILAGAVWDMRKAIGIDRSRVLTHRAKYGTPDGLVTGEALADYFLEILVADDDDGNLANGTPNSAGIIPAFRLHGIPASGVTITHKLLGDQSSVTEPYPLTATVDVGTAIDPALLKASSGRVVFSIDGWKSSASSDLTVTADGRSISGAIPPQRAGSIVQYYIEVTDNYGSTERTPQTAPASSYTFLVGFLSTMLYDCETLDSWTVINDCSTGQWVRAKPIGTYNTELGSPPDVPWVQTDEDHTPGTGKTKCWVTGNAQASLGLGENDIDDGSTILMTRNYDISSYTDPVLRYYRWYSNNSGATPSTDTWQVQISSDAGTTWIDIESTKQSFAFWNPIVFRIKDLIPLGGTMRVQFVPSDTGEGSLVEAALDDFEILDINQALIGIESGAPPSDLALAQNYPNPFNPSTTISYALPAAATVRLSVFSPLGRELAVLADGPQTAGVHRAVFDAAGLPSGTYICQLQVGSRRVQRAMLLLR